MFIYIYLYVLVWIFVTKNLNYVLCSFTNLLNSSLHVQVANFLEKGGCRESLNRIADTIFCLLPTRNAQILFEYTWYPYKRRRVHIHSFLIISNDDNSLISGVWYSQSWYLVEKLPKRLNLVSTPPMQNIQQHDSGN